MSLNVMRLVLVLPLRHQPELENFLQELYLVCVKPVPAMTTCVPAACRR